MNLYKIASISALFCCLAACGNKPAEQAPAPKPAVESSTAPAGSLLSAPADYVQGLHNDVDRAKVSAEKQNKSQQEQQKVLDETTEGN